MYFFTSAAALVQLQLFIPVITIVQKTFFQDARDARRVRETHARRCLTLEREPLQHVVQFPSVTLGLRFRDLRRALRILLAGTAHLDWTLDYSASEWTAIIRVASALQSQKLFELLLPEVTYVVAHSSFPFLVSVGRHDWARRLIQTFFPIPLIDFSILVALVSKTTPSVFKAEVPQQVNRLIDFWSRIVLPKMPQSHYPFSCIYCKRWIETFSPIFGPLKTVELLYCCGFLAHAKCREEAEAAMPYHACCACRHAPALTYDMIIGEDPILPEWTFTRSPQVMSPPVTEEEAANLGIFRFPYRQRCSVKLYVGKW
jgi:hypothetical protein